MRTVLVTGASSFLGYHVAKRLNEQGIRPRVLELAESKRRAARNTRRQPVRRAPRGPAGVERRVRRRRHAPSPGVQGERRRRRGAARGDAADQHRRHGTRLLDVAAAKGVATGGRRRQRARRSASIVGPSRSTKPPTGPSTPSIFPTRRCAGRRNRRRSPRPGPGLRSSRSAPRSRWDPTIRSVRRRTSLIKTLIDGKLRFTLPVGFGCLDVRDFANGGGAGRRARAFRTALSDQRSQRHDEPVARTGGGDRRRSRPAIRAAAVRSCTRRSGRVGIVSKIRGKPAPVTREVLQIIGRYAWYDTSRARTELGWEPRPLQQTLEDTIRWLRATPQAAS